MKSLKLVILVVILSYSNMNLSQKFDLKNLMGIDDSHIVGDTIKLEQNTLIAFNKMREAALEDGIDIKIVSGFRDFERQMLIWNNKYKKYTTEYKLSPTKAIEEIIRFSTIPGTSRHHWGTEIDIIDASDEKYKDEEDVLLTEKYENGIFTKLKRWMDVNSERFGFYLTYVNDKNRKGFEYEPWHYSYKPVSVELLNIFISNDIGSIISTTTIEGKEFISKDFIQKYIAEYVKGVNPILLP